MAIPLPTNSLPARWAVGHLREIRHDMLGFFTRTARECGDVALMRFGPRKVWLISDPALIEEVLVTKNRSFTKHYAFRFLRPVLGDGLLTSEGETWLRQRRLMQPAFTRESLARYATAMVECAAQTADSRRAGEQLDVHRAMTELTLRIAAKTLMDIDIGDEFDHVCQGMDVMMEDFRRRFQSAWQWPRWMPTPANRRRDRAIALLDGVIQGIIAQRRQTSLDHGDLLSMLMRARDADDGTRMSDQQLRDEVMTLLLAGHETTANLLTWAWYLLAQHPAAAAQLHDELRTVLGDRAPTSADLSQLVYTERVVLETMRLLPPAYTIGRAAKEDCQIGQFQVPRDTTLFLSQWVVHHDERWYPDPQRFEPNRWTDELRSARPKYAYFPFGGGPRGCIGNTFAMMEATLLIAEIARRWRLNLATSAPIQPVPAVTLRPAGGMPMIITLQPTAREQAELQVAPHSTDPLHGQSRSTARR
jgi:cytochrome P450